MKKFVPYVLAAAAVTMIAASAQADRRDHGGDAVYAAQQVEQDAYSLVQILARSGPRNTQLIQNGGIVAKEANDLVDALTHGFANPQQEFHEVLRAFDILSDNFHYQGRQSGLTQDAFYRLEYSIQDLEYAFGGGGWDGHDGRDGRDGHDGHDGHDDGGDDWGQNDDGRDDGDWGVIR